MPKECLYCGQQYSDTTNFCPNCGRPTESGFRIRPIQKSEWDRLRREMKEKDELIRQLALTRTMRDEACRDARSSGRRSRYGGDGRRTCVRVLSWEELKEESTLTVREPLQRRTCQPPRMTEAEGGRDLVGRSPVFYQERRERCQHRTQRQ